jgi:hypothetical protein
LLDVVDNQLSIRAKIKAARCFLIQATAAPVGDEQSPVDVCQISCQVFTALGLTS